jgi:ribonuclease HI
MNRTAPHYLLFTEAKYVSQPSPGGRWRFVLEQIGTATRFEESDTESGIRGERLQLLSVVRGLEALDQQSQVTLITSSKYVGRGIRRGISQWRKNNWQWEKFGTLTLIKNHDLWQRIDSAMAIHQINCRIWQFDPPQVRTQVANEYDQVEQGGSSVTVDSLGGIHSDLDDDSAVGKEVSSADMFRSQRVLPIQTRSRGRNHLELNLDSQRKNARVKLRKESSRVAEFLSDRIKPIGQGQAFGYAASCS